MIIHSAKLRKSNRVGLLKVLSKEARYRFVIDAATI